MNEERLAELEALCEAATPGPWERVDVHGVPLGIGTEQQPGGKSRVYRMIVNVLRKGDKDRDLPRLRGDANFIATARTALPEALAEIRRLQGQIAKMNDAMGDDFSNWITKGTPS